MEPVTKIVPAEISPHEIMIRASQMRGPTR